VRDQHGRWVKGFYGGPGRPVGSRNKLSEQFLADLQEDWEQHGKAIFQIMREQFPDVYFQSLVKLAQVHRVELGQPREFDRPCSREEALQRLERSAGPVARKMLEDFLAQVDKLEADQEAGSVWKKNRSPPGGRQK
jgi:hypothetical protein